MTTAGEAVANVPHRGKLARAARWALLGAASGVASWAVTSVTFGPTAGSCVPGLTDCSMRLPDVVLDAVLVFVPGIIFGLVIGLALNRLGLAQFWRVALFAVLSVAAWHAGFFAGAEYGYDWARSLEPDKLTVSYLENFVIGFVGGIAWAIVQTLAVAQLPFARRVQPLATLVGVGAVMAGILLVAVDFVGVGFSGKTFFLFLWTGWYAVYAASLSLFLPRPDISSG